MKKNLFGMLLVLGVSLAPLYGAATDGFIPQAEKSTATAMVGISSGAYASEVSTGAAIAVSSDAAAALNQASTGAAHTDAQLDALLNENAVSSSSGNAIAPLSDYFTIETPALREAGQIKLAEWNQELQSLVNELDKMVRRMADDGVVTSGEFFYLEKALDSYDNLRSYANKELAFYRIRLPENDKVKTYWRLSNIHERHILGDDRSKSVRRFFFNLTGKDVRVKVNVEDIVGKTLLAPLATPFIVILEATGN